MTELAFNVGVELEDSYFIKSGLSEYREIDGQVFRRCSKALALGRLATRTRVNTFRQHLVNYDRWFYARVTQSDGNMAWSSPIWIDYRANWE